VRTGTQSAPVLLLSGEIAYHLLAGAVIFIVGKRRRCVIFEQLGWFLEQFEYD
jgi:hypothetical protein